MARLWHFVCRRLPAPAVRVPSGALTEALGDPMRADSLLVPLLGASLVAGVVATATAQPVTALVEVTQRIDVGDRVEVVDRSGVAFPGRVVRVTADEIVLEGRSGATQTWTASSIQRIDRRGDPLRNGMQVGAMIGGALGGALGAAFSGEFRAADLLSGVAIFGGAGMLVGLGVDASHVGTTTVYVAQPPRAQGSRRGGGGFAVAAVVRW